MYMYVYTHSLVAMTDTRTQVDKLASAVESIGLHIESLFTHKAYKFGSVANASDLLFLARPQAATFEMKEQRFSVWCVQ